MKIEHVFAIPLRIPAPGNESSLGKFDEYRYGLVVVLTDEGIAGFGEISTLWDGAGDVQCSFVRDYFAPRLIGRDPRQIEACLYETRTLREGAEPARAAVDMALFDLTGKAVKQPVYQLLGGRCRDSIPLSRSVMMGTPLEMARKAEEAVEDGYRCVKVKVGRGRDVDRAAVGSVRKAVGDIVLVRVDANMAWATPKEAIANIRLLEGFDLHSVEQPMPRLGIRDWLLLREAVAVPIMVDESVWGPREAWTLLAAGAVDMLNVYVAEAGGLLASRQIFEMGQLAGVPCVLGSMPELGIGTAAAIHLGISRPNLTDPCDAAGAAYQKVDVVTERLEVREGTVTVGDAPGLGVEIDWDSVAQVASDEGTRRVVSEVRTMIEV